MSSDDSEVREGWQHSYSLGAITGLMIGIGIVVAMGGPYWPPFVLFFTAAAGLVAGFLSVARLRRWEGLPVIPKTDRRSDRDAGR